MGKSKRLNQDHAKKKQRPMVKDLVIAEHLINLLFQSPLKTSLTNSLRA
jgi:hypothetical protein